MSGPDHRPHATLISALVGLASTALILSACASGGVSSASIPASPSAFPGTASASPVLPFITPEATIAVPKLASMASDGTVLWVLSASGQIARIDPATNTIGVPKTVAPTWQGDGGFAVSRAGLWLNDFYANLVYRVDRGSLEVIAKVTVGPNPEGLNVDPTDGAVWIANHRGGTIARIDPATNKVAATVAVGKEGPSGPHQIGFGLGSVWVGVPNASAVFRVDPATNKVQATIDIPTNASPCSGFAISEQAVWMPSCQDTTVMVRIDPVTNKVVATVELDGYGDDPVLVNGAPWLVVESTRGGPARLVRIDPASNKIDRVVSLGDGFMGANLVVAAGSVWMTDWNNNQVIRLPLAAFNP